MYIYIYIYYLGYSYSTYIYITWVIVTVICRLSAFVVPQMPDCLTGFMALEVLGPRLFLQSLQCANMIGGMREYIGALK